MPGFALPKFEIPETRRWLPGVVLVICLSMFGAAAVAMLSVGADPKSGPSALPTSTAAQGYQGLKRLLGERGHAVSTNRFEDGSAEAQPRHSDIEFITLSHEGIAPVRRQRAASHSASDTSDSATASSASQASQSQDADAQVEEDLTRIMVDKRRSDHILYNPLGKAVIVVAPKWASGPAPGKPRWGGEPVAYPEYVLRRMLTVLSPVADSPSPNADYDEDSESAEWIKTDAPPGKEIYDDGETLLTYDIPVYDIRHTRTTGPLTIHGVGGQTVFHVPLAVGAITDLQSITGPNLTPVLVGPNGEALISRVSVTQGRRQPVVPVYLVSDPDLLNNQILADPKKVVAALNLIDAMAPVTKGRASVVFNLTFNNLSVERDLLHALSRPPYLGVSLSLILLGLGLTWAAFSRFGPPAHVVEGPALGRGVKVLADNAARIMAIAVKESKLGPAYAQLVRDEVLKARGHPLGNSQQSPDELADRIGRLYGAEDTYTDLKAGATGILTVHQLIDYARRLNAWKEQIGRSEIARGNK